jgi:hypothetical protein
VTLMMTIPLYDRTSVAVICEPAPDPLPPTPPSVQLRVEGAKVGEDLLAQGGTVFVELDPAKSPLETAITIHGGSRNVYVWEGSVRWDRDASGVSHRTYASPADAELQVVALSAGSPPPAAPPDPSSGQAVLKVKVRKKYELPLLSAGGSSDSPRQASDS